MNFWTPAGDSAQHALWIVAPESASERKLLSELKSCLKDLRTSLKPPTGRTYGSILNGHALSFALSVGRGRGALALETAPEPAGGDRAFFDKIAEADDASKSAVAELCRSGKRAFVIVNNKAEGSAPLTLMRLAEQLTAR